MKIRTKIPFALALSLGMFGATYAQTINVQGASFETAYVEWAPVNGATSYNVYYSGAGKTNVKLDDQLVRSYGSYLRADALGLKAGSYTLTIKPVVNGTEQTGTTTQSLNVIAHDRAGFAFEGGRVPGAYNLDGTLKSGAVILYITEQTKDNVTLDVQTDSKGTKQSATGLQTILNLVKKGYETRPIAVRLIGDITDFAVLEGGDIVIENKQNANASLTLEGVGKDATVNGWGIRLKNASNIEVRNLGIMNVNSSEGDNLGLQQNNDHVWVHNCDFFYGHAGSDKDQVKGDGALDNKNSNYVTFSYNHFFDCGKSNLLGLKENVKSTDANPYYITYHHNWYDHSDSRHPRVRFYNAHIYNNYYDGNSKYGAGSTLGSSLFMEANYFRSCKYPMLISMQGNDLYAGGTTRDSDNGTFSGEDGGIIKAYNNTMTGKYSFTAYGENSSVMNSQEDFDAYVAKSRDEKVPSSVKSYQGANYYSNFDTDASIMYSYTADDPSKVVANVTANAGRVQGGDFKWSFTEEDDASSDVNQPLKDALMSYKTTLKSVQGEGSLVITPEVPSSSSSVIPESSSSVKPESSSSVVPESSSSVKPESSSSEPPASSADVQIIAGDLVHNFTTNGTSNDFFAISGNLSKDKGTVTFGSLSLTQCLKLERATSITFDLEKSATLTLVLNGDFNGRVKIDGNNVNAQNGILTVNLSAGAHTITKGDTGNLYYMSIEFDGSAPESSNSKDDASSSSTEPESSSSEAAPESSSSMITDALIAQKAMNVQMHFSNNILEIHASSIKAIHVMNVLGQKIEIPAVNHFNGQTLNLAHLKSGVYIVRVKTSEGLFQKQIIKE